MKIFCVGRNYVEHALELNNGVPSEPVIFMKPPTALLKDDKPFYLPDFTNDCHHELEIVIRIGKNGKSIAEKFAMQYIDGITVGIDFTARDLQNRLKEKSLPWELAKAFDNSAVLGKIQSLDKIKDWQDIDFCLYKNRTIAQQGNTKNMIFSFQQIVSFISRYFTLQKGDLIYTGTPAGVAAVSIGDKLEGFLENDSLFEFEIK